MAFSTFEISELAEESENDYALEITTSNSKHGILIHEDEAEMLGDAILRAVGEDSATIDDFDEQHAAMTDNSTEEDE